jgi:hypothetical protein
LHILTIKQPRVRQLGARAAFAGQENRVSREALIFSTSTAMSLFGFQNNTPKWKLNNITDEDLAQFGLAVRKKEGWKTKILD